MELKPRGQETILRLMQKGVSIPNPLSLDISEEVSADQICGQAVTIYPGSRIYGSRTVIAAGAQIGREAPVTIEDCQLGPGVELKGGAFLRSTFLERASMGMGAQVREGCILEEEASAAHCVGLKQTILFPFVTLGSLINFCDCLMAGGTGRQHHSEVGSGYIHFNFTPDGDKATPSLIGDVPRGVMLQQQPIFLGGQGGLVGPIRVGYGNMVAAGSILRRDYPKENKLIVAKIPPATVIDLTPHSYGGLGRILENNILYLANLAALQQWYLRVRMPLFATGGFAELVYAGALEKLELATQERIKRLRLLAEHVPLGHVKCSCASTAAGTRCEVHEQIESACELFSCEAGSGLAAQERDSFLEQFTRHRQHRGDGYLDAVKSLPEPMAAEGVRWLEQVVEGLCHQASSRLPGMHLFKKTRMEAGGDRTA